MYISTGQLPTDRDKAYKLQIQAPRFSLIDGQLFKRSLGGPYLKCLTPEQSQYVLAKLHEGICENHHSGRTLAHRAHTQGYYWPTMKADATDYTRKCDCYQRLAPILKSPLQDLISISSPWPFAQWGIDIVGPLPTAPAQKKLQLVATDYFISGSRPKHSPRLKIGMSLSLSGRILCADSTSQDKSSPTTGPNLTVESIETSVRN